MYRASYPEWLRIADLARGGNRVEPVSPVINVVERSAGPSVDFRLDVAYYEYSYETSLLLLRLMTGAVVAASSLDQVPSLIICRRFLSAWFQATNTGV
jgi:hypothetical protein